MCSQWNTSTLIPHRSANSSAALSFSARNSAHIHTNSSEVHSRKLFLRFRMYWCSRSLLARSLIPCFLENFRVELAFRFTASFAELLPLPIGSSLTGLLTGSSLDNPRTGSSPTGARAPICTPRSGLPTGTRAPIGKARPILDLSPATTRAPRGKVCTRGGMAA